MKLTPRIRQEASFVSAVLLASFFVGAVYPAIRDWRLAAGPILRSGVSGFFIAFACIAADFIFFRKLNRLPFVLVLLTRTIVFALVGVTVIIVSRFTFTGRISSLFVQARPLFITILITLTVSFSASTVVSLRRALGKQAFLCLFTGRYRRPVEETRMFMFADLVSSTALAEKIGNAKFHQLIHRFWCDISDAILATKGEIYKYVGDEVIVTWALAEGESGDSWLECFFSIRDRIKRNKDEYLQRFGTFPRFRASLHCGKVTAGEVGDCKREVAFLGDTINTTQRILEVGKAYDRDLLLSADALRRISEAERYRIETIPESVLRGKEERVKLYAVEKKLSVLHPK
ncbi:MAG: adenylate/guanylate cyclase domain-containing protein [PVC group bacterium]